MPMRCLVELFSFKDLNYMRWESQLTLFEWCLTFTSLAVAAVFFCGFSICWSTWNRVARIVCAFPFGQPNGGRAEFIVETPRTPVKEPCSPQQIDSSPRPRSIMGSAARRAGASRLKGIKVWTASIETIRRAGARSSSAAEKEMSQNTQPMQPMPVGVKRLLEVTLPPTPARQVSIISQGGRTYGDMQKLVAKRFMVPEAKVRIITVAEDGQNNPETICGEPVSRPIEGASLNQGSLLTAMPQEQQRSMVRCAWRWATQSVMSKSNQVELPPDSRVADLLRSALEGTETDPLDVAVEYLGMIIGLHRPLGQFSNGTLIFHLREVGNDQSPWSSPSLFRAGAKGRERGKSTQIPTSYQKQEMQKWAVQKITEHMPHLPHKVAKHLAKSENRTVSAVMNSKSPVQTAHVVIAALRRAGIDDLANTLTRGVQEAAATEADHGRQEDADNEQMDLSGGEPQQPQSRSTAHTPAVDENQQELTPVQRDIAAVAQMVFHKHTATQSLAYALQQYTQMMNISPWMGTMADHHQRVLSELATLRVAVTELHRRIHVWDTEVLPSLMRANEALMRDLPMPPATQEYHYEQGPQQMATQPEEIHLDEAVQVTEQSHTQSSPQAMQQQPEEPTRVEAPSELQDTPQMHSEVRQLESVQDMQDLSHTADAADQPAEVAGNGQGMERLSSERPSSEPPPTREPRARSTC